MESLRPLWHIDMRTPLTLRDNSIREATRSSDCLTNSSHSRLSRLRAISRSVIRSSSSAPLMRHFKFETTGSTSGFGFLAVICSVAPDSLLGSFAASDAHVWSSTTMGVPSVTDDEVESPAIKLYSPTSLLSPMRVSCSSVAWSEPSESPTCPSGRARVSCHFLRSIYCKHSTFSWRCAGTCYWSIRWVVHSTVHQISATSTTGISHGLKVDDASELLLA